MSSAPSNTRDEIGDLALGYAHAVDARDGAAFVDLWTADGMLHVHRGPGDAIATYAGSEELGAVPGRLARFEQTMHLVMNHTVEMHDETHATGTVYCVAHHVDGPQDLVMYIRYEDEYRKERARWRIASRDCRVQWIQQEPLTEGFADVAWPLAEGTRCARRSTSLNGSPS